MKRKRKIIAFIGTDGSGKSTLLQKMQELFPDVQLLYFGWQPFLITTKWLSRLLKKKNIVVTERANRNVRFRFVQEAMLGYYFIEYVARYLFQMKKEIVLCDRYFYDFYAHYDYASKSVFFPWLLKIFPKPDVLFFLDVDSYTAVQRKPDMNLALVELHRVRYHDLCSKMEAIVIDTAQPVDVCVEQIRKAMERVV
jgi:thymidylate kinase